MSSIISRVLSTLNKLPFTGYRAQERQQRAREEELDAFLLSGRNNPTARHHRITPSLTSSFSLSSSSSSASPPSFSSRSQNSTIPLLPYPARTSSKSLAQLELEAEAEAETESRDAASDDESCLDGLCSEYAEPDWVSFLDPADEERELELRRQEEAEAERYEYEHSGAWWTCSCLETKLGLWSPGVCEAGYGCLEAKLRRRNTSVVAVRRVRLD